MKLKIFNLSEKRSQNFFLKLILLLVVFIYFSLNGFPATPGLWKGNTADCFLATNWDNSSTNNVQGQKVAENAEILKANCGSNEYNLNLNKGCYIINLCSDKLNINKKI